MNYLKDKILIRSYFAIFMDSFFNSIINRCAILLNLINLDFFPNLNNLLIQLIFDPCFALINAHTFSIGFKSEEYGGQSINVIYVITLSL